MAQKYKIRREYISGNLCGMITTEYTNKKFRIGQLVKRKKTSSFKILDVEKIVDSKAISAKEVLNQIQNDPIFKSAIKQTKIFEKHTQQYITALKKANVRANEIMLANGYTMENIRD